MRTSFQKLFILCLLFLFGCISASKRFHKNSHSEKKTDEKKNRFTNPIEDEVKQDDKKIDIKNIRKPILEKTNSKTDLKEKMMESIVSLLGTPYVYGGEDKNGMDCSAFTKIVFNDVFQILLPRTTKEQMQLGTEIKRENLQLGDLIFFNTSNEIPSHVGIFIEDDLFAHASVSFGVTISSLESSYYKKTYITAKRILN